jgi:hypothetical protein
VKRAVTITMPALTQGRATFLAALMDRLKHYPQEKFDITIERHIERRTLSQNAMLWGVIYPQILERAGEQLGGWNAEELHEFMLGMHFGWRRLTVRDEDGTVHALQVPHRRSSRLSTKEFSDYVEFIVRFWAEHGVVLDLPGDIMPAQHTASAQEVQAEPALSAPSVGGDDASAQ